ncbi:MAG: PP2C family protein-serine/threonine phosphatase [Phycisphaerales bacterium JB059]
MPPPEAIPDTLFHLPTGEHLFRVELPFADVVVGLACSPLREGSEDVALVIPIGERAALLAIADGAGGHDNGARAATHTLTTLRNAAEGVSIAPGQTARPTIVAAIEQANHALVEAESDSACTLVIAEINDSVVSAYHAGDAQALITGQRGRLKHVTPAHSPVHSLHASGQIDEHAALAHEDRHLVSNLVGDPEMHIEVGAGIRMAARDTLLLASDGLFDNFTIEEIRDRIRVGAIDDAAGALLRQTRERMTDPEPGHPSKPDDLSFVLYRPSHSKRSR